MKGLYRLRLKIERARKAMHKATGDNLLFNSRQLDKLLSIIFQLAVGEFRVRVQ